jgi:hypothetical protein
MYIWIVKMAEEIELKRMVARIVDLGKLLAEVDRQNSDNQKKKEHTGERKRTLKPPKKNDQ